MKKFPDFVPPTKVSYLDRGPTLHLRRCILQSVDYPTLEWTFDKTTREGFERFKVEEAPDYQVALDEPAEAPVEEKWNVEKPTNDAEGSPVRVGDFILEVNGQPVADYLKTELQPYGNLGQGNSSYVVAGATFPLRTSYNTPLPTDTRPHTRLRNDTRSPLLPRPPHRLRPARGRSRRPPLARRARPL